MAVVVARGGAAMTSMDEAGGRRRRQRRCVGPSLPLGVRAAVCANPLFQVTLLDWVFQHWIPRNATSHHKDCLTKRAVGERVVGKQARKCTLMRVACDVGEVSPLLSSLTLLV